MSGSAITRTNFAKHVLRVKHKEPTFSLWSVRHYSSNNPRPHAHDRIVTPPRSLVFPSAFPSSSKVTSLSTFTQQFSINSRQNMVRDTSHQSDISKGNPTTKDGAFNRAPASFRNSIQKDGQYTPEAGRYHLYVSLACPWAHRTLIVRKLKGLEDIISVSTVSPRMGSDGWPFSNADDFPGATTDPINNANHVKDLYLKTEPEYSGRFTVPVLWDKKTGTIVNNESSEIIRIFNTELNDLISPDKVPLNFYPPDLRSEIDEVNAWIYDTVNNGVYKSGFATTQQAYEAAVKPLFESLDRIEKMLEGKEYLIGDRLTEADIRLYTTIVRFDPVYHGHFKCNFRTIRGGYPNINRWLKNLYWKNDAFKSTTDFNHIKTHYYWSHQMINPTRVVPAGPVPVIEPL